jgi:hypothetical protein
MTQRAKCTYDDSGPRQNCPKDVCVRIQRLEKGPRLPSPVLAIYGSRGSVVLVGSAGALIGGGGAARG